MLRRELWPSFVNVRFFAGQLKQLCHLLGEYSLAAHPALEVRVVELAASYRANPVENFFFTFGKMLLQPLLEQRLHCKRQTQSDIARKGRASFGSGSSDRRRFGVGKPRDHWRLQVAHWNSSVSERGDRGQAACRT